MITREEYNRRLTEAFPHGPDEPCTAPHHILGCTCDIDWEVAYELRYESIEGEEK